ncbi:MAG TPA: hypothetical protein DCS48_02500 [Desulfovibrio sp.]|nr:hypothetical protein [Desulfovibrio sp.]
MNAFDGFSSVNLFGEKSQKVSLRRGLDLVWGEFSLDSPVEYTFQTSGDACELAFVLSGTIYNSLPEVSFEVAVPSGYAAVWNPPKMKGVHGCFPEENICFVCVSIQRKFLREILSGEHYAKSRKIQSLLRKSRGDVLCHLVPMNTAMMAAVRDILFCPYEAEIGRIYQEGKSLELISHTMGSILSECGQTVGPPEKDKDSQIRFARRILLENMVSPPSLEELADRVGLSVSSLTRGFRVNYGASVFEYLRNVRLEKAQSFLSEGKMNVTEVAYALGFSSPAHLTRIFTARYDITPGEYRRSFRK